MVDDIKLPGRGKHSAGNEDNKNDDEPTFTPPEEIAQSEEIIDMSSDGKPNKTKKEPKKTSKFKSFLTSVKSKWSKLSKKQKIIAAVILLLIFGGLSAGAYALFFKPKPTAAPVVQEKKEEPPKPTTEPSKLTGLEVPIGTNENPIIGVMIENSPDARPQAGLKDAGVVFEAVAEGGITRFLALFLDSRPDYVGPVRSVRPYYLQWLQAFDAPISHAGGSNEAKDKISRERIPDLDHGANGSYYQRVSNRYAPHNLYTNMQRLLELSKNKGFAGNGTKSLARKAEAPAATPTARTINLSISSPLYNVSYAYDPATNSYLRSMGGSPHTDERSGEQIKPKVVVALAMTKGIAANGIHTTYGAIGSGTVFIFQDGVVAQGTWTKPSDTEQFTFADAAGAPIALNPGQTWFSVVSLVSSVTFAP